VVGMGAFAISSCLLPPLVTDASLTGAMLFRKIKAAASEMHDHVMAHHEYEASLPSAAIAHWTEEVEAWEKDPSQPNPFEVKVVSTYDFPMICEPSLTSINSADSSGSTSSTV
jgi:hypothetical protein